MISLFFKVGVARDRRSSLALPCVTICDYHTGFIVWTEKIKEEAKKKGPLLELFRRLIGGGVGSCDAFFVCRCREERTNGIHFRFDAQGEMAAFFKGPFKERGTLR